jgi:hypothetical protein
VPKYHLPPSVTIPPAEDPIVPRRHGVSLGVALTAADRGGGHCQGDTLQPATMPLMMDFVARSIPSSRPSASVRYFGHTSGRLLGSNVRRTNPPTWSDRRKKCRTSSPQTVWNGRNSFLCGVLSAGLGELDLEIRDATQVRSRSPRPPTTRKLGRVQTSRTKHSPMTRVHLSGRVRRT